MYTGQFETPIAVMDSLMPASVRRRSSGVSPTGYPRARPLSTGAMNASIEDALRHIIREELAAWVRVPLEPAVALPASEGKATSRPLDPLQLYSVAEAAAVLHMSPEWVYRRINDGQMGVVEFGSGRSKRRIAAAEIERFITMRKLSASR